MRSTAYTPLNIAILTAIALIAFAGNSVLCRLALGNETIDAASFTVIRLVSGVITLVAIHIVFGKARSISASGNWSAAFCLFVYAAAFSFGYVSLQTGVGALVLFGSVQMKMVLYGLMTGNRLHLVEWFGLVAAFTGFLYLVYPDLTTPSAVGFALMTIAGVAWAFYTLLGKGAADPLADTTGHFIRTLPFVVLLFVIYLPKLDISMQGVVLAVLSGSVASGIGYAIWYAALKGLTAIQAAVLQLFVPVIAAIGGVAFSGEEVEVRLVLSSVIILGGILTVILGKRMLNSV